LIENDDYKVILYSASHFELKYHKVSWSFLHAVQCILVEKQWMQTKAVYCFSRLSHMTMLIKNIETISILSFTKVPSHYKIKLNCLVEGKQDFVLVVVMQGNFLHMFSPVLHL